MFQDLGVDNYIITLQDDDKYKIVEMNSKGKTNKILIFK